MSLEYLKDIAIKREPLICGYYGTKIEKIIAFTMQIFTNCS